MSPRRVGRWALVLWACAGAVACGSDAGPDTEIPYTPPTGVLNPSTYAPPSVGPVVGGPIGEDTAEEDAPSDAGADGDESTSGDAAGDGGQGEPDVSDDTDAVAEWDNEDAESDVDADAASADCAATGCGEGLACVGGGCKPLQCEPFDRWCSADGALMVCDPSGTQITASVCPSGFRCDDGTCAPPEPNYLIVFDTSGSMSNAVLSSPPAPWPACDNLTLPGTALGISKAAFTNAIDQSADEDRRFALMHFPQTRHWVSNPTCTKNYYTATADARLTGDVGDHAVPLSGTSWFDDALQEVVAEPFSATEESNDAAIVQWLDFYEAIEVVEGVSCAQCPGFCDNGCYVHSNPELRAGGGTPLGRTLFYAGEYLRKYVLVEGKPCGEDADCGSPHYSCVEHVCHDPAHACRRTEVLLFTDGLETDALSELDFFHPVNQAKRLFAGLGCEETSDCAPGSSCVDSICLPAGDDSLIGSLVDNPPQGVCPTTLDGCIAGGLGQCPIGTCTGPWHFFVDSEQGVNALYGYDGEPIRVRVHVIDASDDQTTVGATPKELAINPLTALWGGGEYIRISPEDSTELQQAIQSLAVTKPDSSCSGANLIE